MNLSVITSVCLSVCLLLRLSACLRADLPAALSVCSPSCLIVCFDLRHSTWSPSSSVPFPNNRHPPQCSSPRFICPTASGHRGPLLGWRKIPCSSALPWLETKGKPKQALALVTFSSCSLNIQVGATHERNNNKIHLPYHCFLAALLKCSKVLQDLKHCYTYFVWQHKSLNG